jgi:hypothetical protein
VRPNSGRIEPGDTAEVAGEGACSSDNVDATTFCDMYAVMLQAMKEEPALSAKCRDKFLIQSTLITQDMQTLPVHDIVWVSLQILGYMRLICCPPVECNIGGFRRT